jgi:hypothetical protein
MKKVWSFSSENWVNCAWFECRRPGFEMHKTVLHDHARTLRCDNPLSGHVNFVFCSERHKQLYLNSHKNMGKMPPGYKLTM